MATRTHARQAVIELLYAFESGNSDIRKFADEILASKKIKNAQAAFALSLFDGVTCNLARLDNIMRQFLESWDIERLGIVDKSIIRLGIYELLFSDIDLPVIINEAIELSKVLGSDNTARFVNGVLDTIGKQRGELRAQDSQDSKTQDLQDSKALDSKELDSKELDSKELDSRKVFKTQDSKKQDSQDSKSPKLCLALDMPSRAQNLALCENLAKANLNDLYLKIGLRSFIRDGNAFVRELQELGFKIFLDLKLYDIPNTMLDALREIMNLRVQMLTIHASAGRDALLQVAKFAHESASAPLIFAVTALTSFDEENFGEIYGEPLQKGIDNFAKIVSECGINGVVCAAHESRAIKEKYNLLTLCPGIRATQGDFGAKIKLYDQSDDQHRVASIRDAIAAHADFIVIGRPIYTHANPVEMTREILNVLNQNSRSGASSVHSNAKNSSTSNTNSSTSRTNLRTKKKG